MPFIHAGYDRKKLFLRFEHSFVLWCVKRNRQDVSLAVKAHLLHSQMRQLEVSLGGVGHNSTVQLLRR